MPCPSHGKLTRGAKTLALGLAIGDRNPAPLASASAQLVHGLAEPSLGQAMRQLPKAGRLHGPSLLSQLAAKKPASEKFGSQRGIDQMLRQHVVPQVFWHANANRGLFPQTRLEK